jgi:hypothetical protein
MGESPDDVGTASGGRGDEAVMGAGAMATDVAEDRAGAAPTDTEGEQARVSDEPSAGGQPLAPLRIEVEPRSPRAYRGRTLDLRGRIVDARGEGVAGLRVEVSLDDPGGRAPSRRLGLTLTHDQGWFAGTFGIPVDVEVGEYPLRVRTPGDATHAAAEAR